MDCLLSEWDDTILDNAGRAFLLSFGLILGKRMFRVLSISAKYRRLVRDHPDLAAEKITSSPISSAGSVAI